MSYSALLTQTITAQSPSGRSVYGDTSYGAKTEYRARVLRKSKIVYGVVGELQSDTQICTESALPLESRVWLPGQDTDDVSIAKRVLAVDQASRPDATLTVYVSYL